MRKKRGCQGLMIIKIDLEKAYDIFVWDFIRDTLLDVGMGNEWTNNIMNCIESPRLSILWEGE